MTTQDFNDALDIVTPSFTVNGSPILSNPLTSRGDILYQDASITTRLPIGTVDKILTTIDGVDASWQYPQNQNTTLLMRQLMGSPIIAETRDSFDCANGSNMASGKVNVEAIYIPFPMLVSGAIVFLVTAQGIFTANNENAIGLYSYSAGILTRIAISANNGDIWEVLGPSQVPFVTPITLSKGLYFVASIYSSSAQTQSPAIKCHAVNQPITLLETNDAKSSSFITNQTALASSIAMSSLTLNSAPYYFALY